MEPMQNISDFNKTIIRNHGEEVLTDRLNPYFRYASLKAFDSEPNQSWLGRVFSWFNPRAIGETLGWAVGMTHGQEITNKAVGAVAGKIFEVPAPTPQAATGWLGWFSGAKETIQVEAAKGAVEMAKLTITPYAVPVVVAGLTLAGGLAGYAAGLAIQALYAKCKNKKVEDLTLKDIDDVGQMVSKRGDKLFVGDEDITDELKPLVKITHEYTICKRLLQLDKTKAVEFMESHVITRKDGVRVLADGHILDKAETKHYEKALKLLNMNNLSSSSKALTGTIHLFAKHIAHSVVKDMHKDSPLDLDTIVCGDGIVCDKTGIIFTPEEMAVMRQVDEKRKAHGIKI